MGIAQLQKFKAGDYVFITKLTGLAAWALPGIIDTNIPYMVTNRAYVDSLYPFRLSLDKCFGYHDESDLILANLSKIEKLIYGIDDAQA